MKKIIKVKARFAFRSDTKANWESQNPILLAGEHGVVTDGTSSEREKIGDGVTPWNDLGWWCGPQGEKGETGKQGVSGVYVGAGDMPEGYNVQIDPNGETVDMNTLATKQYVDEEIATFDFIKVVDTLPDTGLPNKIYLVPRDEADGNNLFDEYIWANSAWEFITTKVVEVDLTNYPTKTELTEQLDPIKTALAKLGVDYIVERGTTKVDGVTWTYEKWASGKAICWGINSYVVNITTAAGTGGWCYSAVIEGAKFPFSFMETQPVCQITTQGGIACVVFNETASYASPTKTQKFFLARYNSVGSATVVVNYYAVGTWK